MKDIKLKNVGSEMRFDDGPSERRLSVDTEDWTAKPMEIIMNGAKSRNENTAPTRTVGFRLLCHSARTRRRRRAGSWR
jgi:hypothetical protein